jgi:hypothetical protein
VKYTLTEVRIMAALSHYRDYERAAEKLVLDENDLRNAACIAAFKADLAEAK